ncbi:hypothetical protein QQF64_005883 [Cirrhinus molitorella]|uniref:Uncharacterized protein n=1 Tax=Cirrhinus molitorella TaxID=172907 RepID=A0ABR3MGN6_9TELE
MLTQEVQQSVHTLKPQMFYSIYSAALGQCQSHSYFLPPADTLAPIPSGANQTAQPVPPVSRLRNLHTLYLLDIQTISISVHVSLSIARPVSPPPPPPPFPPPPPPPPRLYPPSSLLPPTLFPLTKLALAPSIWSPFLQQPRTCSHLLSCWTALNISSDARAILALATSLSFNPSVRSELCLPPASAFFFKKRKTPSRSEAKRIADATNLQTTPSLSIRHPYQQTN